MISSLEYFLSVAKYGSISKAAEVLYISQPALSAAIIRLENKLNIKLFERNKNGLILTPAGKIVYKYASDICSSHELMMNELKVLLSPQSQVLKIGSGFRHSVQIVDEYLFNHPSESVLLTQYNNYYELKNALLTGEIDICISAPPVNGTKVTCHDLCVEHLCVVYNINNTKYTKFSNVPFNIFSDAKLITLPETYPLRIVIDKFFKENNIVPNYIVQAENSALTELLYNSHNLDYVAIYPKSRCIELCNSYQNLRYKKINGDICRTISASWLDKTPITKQFHNFLEFLEIFYSNQKFSEK